MALKFKVDDIDTVDEQYRGLYEKADDGKYKLSVEGVDDIGPLKRAKDREKERAIAAEEAAEALKDEIAEIKKKISDGEYSAAKGKGDIEALEKSWKEKLEARESELSGKLDEVTSALERQMVESAVDQIAGIFVAPKTQREYIKSRLKVEVVDGKPVTRVMDEAGKPTAMTLAELSEQLKNDPELAPIVVGSKATGGGASGGASGGGGGAPVDLSKASRKERLAHYKNTRKTD